MLLFGHGYEVCIANHLKLQDNIPRQFDKVVCNSYIKTNFFNSEFLIMDEFIIDRIKAHDEYLLQELVHEHTKYLFFVIKKYKLDESKEKEVLQETWKTFIEKIDLFKGKSKIRTFITGIMINKVRELRRTEKRHKSPDDVMTEDVYDELWENRFDGNGHWVNVPVDPETSAIRSETGEIIGNCMENLTEEQRMVFHLKELEGHSNKKICEIMKISTNNVGVLLFRSKNKLRDCIEGILGRNL